MVLRAVDVGIACSFFLLAGCLRQGSSPPPAPVEVPIGGARASEVLTTPSSEDESLATWELKEEVDVEWRGSWFPAIVLERRGSRYLVHYVGYDAEWDETVVAARVRDRRAAPAPDESAAAEEPPSPP